ncbi:S1 family peptidase [Streptomyces sp. tea 10]|nr:S1 family peptidase [Streptomyces sp. tea 10]
MLAISPMRSCEKRGSFLRFARSTAAAAATAALAAGVITSLAWPANALSLPPRGSAPAHAVIRPPALTTSDKQEVLDKIATQITQNLTEGDRAKIPGFTEIEVDPIHNQLRLHWKGTPPKHVTDILAHLPNGITAKVIPARYSKADLHAARDKLMHGGKPIDLHIRSQSTPVRITSMGGAVDGSGLEITYASASGTAARESLTPAVREERSREVKALTDRLTGISTTANYKPVPDVAPPAAHPAGRDPSVKGNPAVQNTRLWDMPAWTGGSALRTPTGSLCSSGFGIKNEKGQNMLTTALHCNGNDGLWRTYGGNTAVGGSDGRELNTSVDVQGIDLPQPEVTGDLYDGPAKANWHYVKPITGPGQNFIGDYVCEDGANGGVHCQLKIEKTDVGTGGSGGWWRPIADLACTSGLTSDKSGCATPSSTDDIAGVNGDSGAPVFFGVNNFTADEARGTLTTFDGEMPGATIEHHENSCSASEKSDVVDTTTSSGTPWCFPGLYYVPIRQTLATMNWTLVTGQ